MTKEQCLNLILDQGCTFAQAIGLMANIEAESAYYENALGDKNAQGEFTSYGLCQWHGVRWERLKKYAGTATTVPAATQIQFILYEMEKWYPKTYKIFKDIGNDQAGAEKFAYYFCYNYEVPADRKNKSMKRAERASELYEELYKEPLNLDRVFDDILFYTSNIEELIRQWKKQ